MMENRRRNAPFPDPEQRPACGSEFTRTASDASSITVESSKGSLHQTVNKEPVQIMKWTDEKHCSYLKSLETAFVEELNHSMQLCNSRSRKNMWGACSTQYLSTNMCKPAEQYVVLQDGCWKIKFDRDENYEDSAVDSHVNVETPGECHFMFAAQHQYMACNAREDSVSCSERIYLGKRVLSSSGLATSSGQCHLCQNHLGSSAEASDQNFVEEDSEQKLSCVSTAKRLKTAAIDTFNNDQIGPSGNFHRSDKSFTNDALDGQAQNDKLLSEPL